ncbi:MAG TPA: NAD(P)H-binding protein [Candidatus Acidoferrum sp.]|jgi:uncharacterized protein YbjT (DUF2867 family)
MYVIVGATGNTGSVIAEALLAKGEKVRAIGRDKEKLAKLASKGAEVASGDTTDAAFLTKAFEGARAVYFMVPPNMSSEDYRGFQRKVFEAGATAIENAKVHYVVALSSYGADKESGCGPVSGLHEMETRISKIPGLNVLFLRPGYFFENLLGQVGAIQGFGVVASPVRGDLKTPAIATEDIANVAAEHLLKLDFSGIQTKELLGERDLTYTEFAKALGDAIGKPDLQYMQMPNEQFIGAVMQMGMSRNFAESMTEMCDALNSGHMVGLEARTAANTTSTSIETFARDVFAPAFKGGKAASA